MRSERIRHDERASHTDRRAGPSTGIAACCAGAITGRAPVLIVPAMNSRRRMCPAFKDRANGWRDACEAYGAINGASCFSGIPPGQPELWGQGTDPSISVYVDAWEPYLEPT